MTATELPEVVDRGQHRRRASGLTGQRIGLGALLVGIAVATVAVPPLITPDKPRTPAAAVLPPSTALAPAVTISSSSPSPSPSLSRVTPAAAAPSAAPSAVGPPNCAGAPKGGTVQVTNRPACAIYTDSLGNGWNATGNGMEIHAVGTVPDTPDLAMRVERTRPALPATALSISATQPVRIAPGAKVTLRVWGGRDFGTKLHMSVAPAGSGTVTLTAPADKWTSFSVQLGDLTPGARLTRIDFTVDDQVPNINRFFLDDIALVP